MSRCFSHPLFRAVRHSSNDALDKELHGVLCDGREGAFRHPSQGAGCDGLAMLEGLSSGIKKAAMKAALFVDTPLSVCRLYSTKPTKLSRVQYSIRRMAVMCTKHKRLKGSGCVSRARVLSRDSSGGSTDRLGGTTCRWFLERRAAGCGMTCRWLPCSIGMRCRWVQIGSSLNCRRTVVEPSDWLLAGVVAGRPSKGIRWRDLLPCCAWMLADVLGQIATRFVRSCFFRSVSRLVASMHHASHAASQSAFRVSLLL